MPNPHTSLENGPFSPDHLPQNPAFQSTCVGPPSAFQKAAGLKPSVWLGALALGAIVASQAACSLCGNSDAKEYFSPDHTSKVVVFTRDCGATTDFSTQVSVLDASASLRDDEGNAFILDSNHGKAPGGLEVTWRDRRTVELSHHADARVFKAESSVKGIKLLYTTWH